MPAHFASRVLVSGGLAAAAVTLVASFAARRATGSSAAALNATSHIAWGEKAGRKDAYSLKYTGTGALANYGACLLWALCYELLPGKRRTRAQAFFTGAVVSAVAYVTDYHIVPRRLTPGFEMRLRGGALTCIYAALAFGLGLRDVLFPSAGKPRAGRPAMATMERYPGDPIAQAAADRSRGLEDTDCRVLDQSSLEHCPRPAPGK